MQTTVREKEIFQMFYFNLYLANAIKNTLYQLY